MDKRTKRYFGLGIGIAFLIALIFIEYIYLRSGSLSLPVVVTILTGTAVGVVGSYLMYHSFFERERQMVFAPEEEVILQRKYPNRSVVIPQIVNRGDSPNESPVEVNLYLTNIGVAAEPPGTGEPILYIPFSDIQEMQTVNRVLLKYIRIRYIDINGSLAEVLLYVGNETDLWAENIGRLILS